MPQANDLTSSNQKKQKKMKDQESSPGLPFRGGIGMKNSDSLRSNQKIFPGVQSAANQKRAI